ncbi:MAG: hypothetical protein ACRDZM_08220 [Acidimicrobiia bacterium]
MISTPISDQAIELLLGGEPDVGGELAHLVRFVEVLQAQGHRAPSEGSIHRLAVEAAIIAREARPSTPADKGLPDRKSRSRLMARPQLAAVLTVLILAWGTGVAAAADAAAPGHSLYGLDLALEKVGIGAGSTGERLEEAGQLLAGGDTRFALEHASEALEGAGDEDDVESARAALDGAIEALSARDAQIEATDQVAALLTYLTENLGPGVGADGREFGQGVAELARGISQSGEFGEPAPETETPADTGDQPDHPGPPPGLVPDGPGGNENNGHNGTNNPGNDNVGNDNVGNGNGDNGDNGDPGKENGPPQGSPSETTPGRGNRP